MTEGEKYKLSLYKSEKVLKKSDNCVVELVCSSLDSKRYIKKTYFEDKRTIFNKLREISSNNLPKIFEVFFSDCTIVIEEFIEGKTLEWFIESGHKFKKSKMKKIAVSLCDAVYCLHKSGIIHRDIKPSNIIIKNDEAVLIDFGIARVFSKNRDNDTEHYGTVGYAPPEQFGFSQSDERTDIYALGMTLKKFNAFNKVVKKCCEFDPNKRYQNVLDVKRNFHENLGFVLILIPLLVALGLFWAFFPKQPSDVLANTSVESKVSAQSRFEESSFFEVSGESSYETQSLQNSADISQTQTPSNAWGYSKEEFSDYSDFFENDSKEQEPSKTQTFSKETVVSKEVVSSQAVVSSSAPDPCYYGHTWVDVTEIVHHEEKGEYQLVTDTKTVLYYDCQLCSGFEKLYTDLDTYYAHFDVAHTLPYDKYMRNLYEEREELVSSEKKVWVVTQKAYDEEVVVGIVCQVCKETR